MKFAQDDAPSGPIIHAYEPGRIQVGEIGYRRSLVISPDRVLDDWRPQTPEQLGAEDFEPILALSPEIIVLGTGASQRFPDPATYGAIMNRGVGLEIMDTGAACRTYNILMSENRRVVAALIMI